MFFLAHDAAAYPLAQRGHGDLGTQLEEAHAHDEQHRPR